MSEYLTFGVMNRCIEALHYLNKLGKECCMDEYIVEPWKISSHALLQNVSFYLSLIPHLLPHKGYPFLMLYTPRRLFRPKVLRVVRGTRVARGSR